MNPGLMMLLLDLPLWTTPASVAGSRLGANEYHFPFVFFELICFSSGHFEGISAHGRDRALEFSVSYCDMLLFLICKPRSLFR